MPQRFSEYGKLIITLRCKQANNTSLNERGENTVKVYLIKESQTISQNSITMEEYCSQDHTVGCCYQDEVDVIV